MRIYDYSSTVRVELYNLSFRAIIMLITDLGRSEAQAAVRARARESTLLRLRERSTACLL